MLNKPPKKVHLLVPALFDFNRGGRSGIQVYLQDLLKAIKSQIYHKDLELLILDKLDKNQHQADSDYQNISFLFSGHIPDLFRLQYFIINILWSIIVDKPDLIISAHINFSPLVWLINKVAGIPYWIVVYGAESWNIEDRPKKQGLLNAEKIVSISQYTRDRLVREQTISPDRFFLLPVTFDPTRFPIQEKPQYLLDRYHLKPEQPVILTVSRLDIQAIYKGYDPILRALPKIRSQIPNVRYILVGKGSDRPRIEQLINELDLQENVILAGFVPDEELSNYYNLCDLFAMVGRSEGFGIVYLEALACGKPTLGGNQDGAVDALCHGELGALVDPNDLEEIAATTVQILQGTYAHPIMYQPEALRQKVIDTYGFKAFEHHVKNLFNF
jgi:glycosyltransferase involved in cell wall biosynthesis